MNARTVGPVITAERPRQAADHYRNHEQEEHQMTQSELHDQKMATLALQNVRTYRHIFEAAELAMIGAIRTAIMFGATHEELAEIVSAVRLDRWLPLVDLPEVGDWLLVTGTRDFEGGE